MTRNIQLSVWIGDCKWHRFSSFQLMQRHFPEYMCLWCFGGSCWQINFSVNSLTVGESLTTSWFCHITSASVYSDNMFAFIAFTDEHPSWSPLPERRELWIVKKNCLSFCPLMYLHLLQCLTYHQHHRAKFSSTILPFFTTCCQRQTLPTYRLIHWPPFTHIRTQESRNVSACEVVWLGELWSANLPHVDPCDQ